MNFVSFSLSGFYHFSDTIILGRWSPTNVVVSYQNPTSIASYQKRSIIAADQKHAACQKLANYFFSNSEQWVNTLRIQLMRNKQNISSSRQLMKSGPHKTYI